MGEPRIGSLFSGMGGLDMGVQAVLGGHVAWTCEVDPAASNILSHHWPEVPNLGDIADVKWVDVEQIDVLVGGFPCTDISHAGKRAGLAGADSGLWSHMLDAIDRLRPQLVVIENVSALRSAKTHESTAVRVAGPRGGVRVERTHRALGAVLGGLADVGYDASWGSVRAADVGAPHKRERVFVLAYPQVDGRGEGGPGTGQWPGSAGQPASDSPTAAHPGVTGLEGLGPAEPRGRDGAADSDRGAVALLPTPTWSMSTGAWTAGWDGGPNLQSAVALLPTPAVNDMGANKTVEWWDEWAPRQQAWDGRSAPHGKSLSIELRRLLPTPTAMDSKASGGAVGSPNVTLTDATVRLAERFGQYAPAIARWEQALGRPAPPPVTDGHLSARFVEWMMGLPEGHVTDVGLSKTQQLKILGNGVVPQQAALAVEVLLVGVS